MPPGATAETTVPTEAVSIGERMCRRSRCRYNGISICRKAYGNGIDLAMAYGAPSFDAGRLAQRRGRSEAGIKKQRHCEKRGGLRFPANVRTLPAEIRLNRKI
jgi:hypothetical protein